ncbi:MAG: sulfatase-like hydrolase/transferase [Luteolibacter sp.]
MNPKSNPMINNLNSPLAAACVPTSAFCRAGWVRSSGLLLASAVALGVGAAPCPAAVQPHSKPNIVYILADDLGHGDVKSFNPACGFATPGVDRLAREGMRFTDAHSASAVCSPTRYGLLTGRYPWRTRLQRGVMQTGQDPLIARDVLTVPQFLKQQGYKTAIVGKWHLGFHYDLPPGTQIEKPKGEQAGAPVGSRVLEGPITRGFDRFWGYHHAGEMRTWIEQDRVTANISSEEMLPRICATSVAYIRERGRERDVPFFLYIPLNSPHGPLVPTEEWRGRSGLNIYADYVMQTDDVVRQIVEALDESGLAENTLVVFTSDNGCAPVAKIDALRAKGHDPLAGLRGHKADIWEGGHRVPFVVRWPAVVEPGSVSTDAICHNSLLATCADILGTPLPEGAGADSFSILPLLDRTPLKQPTHPLIVHASVQGNFAIRQGPWKFVACQGSGGWSRGDDGHPAQLYDMAADRGEQSNRIESDAAVAGRMADLLERTVAAGRSRPGPAASNDVPVDIWKTEAGRPALLRSRDAGDSPGQVIDLQSSREGLKILHSYSGDPDAQGVMETFTLQVPAFTRGVYYRGFWWPYGGNRVRGNIITRPEGDEGGMFLLLELEGGGYLAALPLCGDQAYAWFAPDGAAFQLKFGTHGTASIRGDMPLLCWVRANSPYEACYRVWKMASEAEQIRGHLKLREKKSYPEVFKYLGWCSWEGYHKKISSEGLTLEMKGLRDSGVPVRYFLVDDGHFDTRSLAPDPGKFPDGYKPLTDLRSKDGIRWVGMWHALLGDATAVSVGHPEGILDSMMMAHNGRMVPKPDARAIETFLRYLVQHSVRDGIDFVKVDFCGTLLPVYAGTTQKLPLGSFPDTNEHAIGNPSEATATYARLYQKVMEDEFNGLINCNWHVPHFLFNSGNSVVGRCSEDYKLGNLKQAKAHLYHSYSAIPWQGQIAWGDHDMFHSSDPAAGRMMAVSKALSGGPVYLSDRREQLVPELIRPLCYEDGQLLRPLAPASPLREDLFHDLTNTSLYRVMAPLANRSAVFAVYNFLGDGEGTGPELSAAITADDYASASAMVQPYAGPWEVPQEGLVVYDWDAGQARKLDGQYPVSIRGFGERLLQVSPIQHGWSVIGRTDKYLPAAAVEVLACSDRQLKLKLHEAGPLAVWCADGVPEAKGVRFVPQGNGLFKADLPLQPGPVVHTIERR